MKLVTTANMGARPALFVRDVAVGLMQLGVGGPKLFAEGVARMMTREGREAAQKYLVHTADIQGYFGDLTGDLPTGRGPELFNKFADTVLLPSRLGHNIPRMIAGLGEESSALREIAKYRAGKIDAGELLNNTSAWFQDPAARTRLLGFADARSGLTTQEAAEKFAHFFNDTTQFSMTRGTQGAIFRTGAGKLLGQYGTWPANYQQFVRKMAARALENPKKGVPAMATFMALNYGALSGAKALSVDASKWLFFSPAGYASSPAMGMLSDIMVAPEETTAGREARGRLLQAPVSNLMPLGTQFNSVMSAFESDGSVNIPRLLGFRPAKDQDKDLEDWLKQESGLGEHR
jgi:hypothetical protein